MILANPVSLDRVSKLQEVINGIPHVYFINFQTKSGLRSLHEIQKKAQLIIIAMCAIKSLIYLIGMILSNFSPALKKSFDISHRTKM